MTFAYFKHHVNVIFVWFLLYFFTIWTLSIHLLCRVITAVCHSLDRVNCQFTLSKLTVYHV